MMLLRDIQLSLRQCVRRPVATLAVVAVLALGIGSVTAIWSVVEPVLLDDLPFPEPHRLVQIETVRAGERGLISMLELRDLEERLDLWDGMAAYLPGGQYSIRGESGPEKPPAILMTHDLFEVLGVHPAIGGPWPDDYDVTRSFGLVLSHDLWERQFGSDPAVVGSTIPLDASPFYTPAYELFGVLPEGFDFPARTDLYRSIFINDVYPDLEHMGARYALGIARLRPGVPPDEAARRVAAVGTELQRLHPETNEGVELRLRSLREVYAGDLRPYLVTLLAAVGLLLVVACANVGNLLLSRAVVREGEMAVRSALGATRGHLVGQLLAEGAVLGVLGGIGGVVLALAGTALFAGSPALDLPTWMEVRVDGSVLLFALGVSLLAGLLVSLVPAARLNVDALMPVLRRDGRSGEGRSSHRIRSSLVAAEVALSVTVLIGAGLLVRTWGALAEQDPGFRQEGVLSFQVPLPWSYPRTERIAFQVEALRRIEELPGVRSAALNAYPPLTDVAQPSRELFAAEGQGPSEWARNPTAHVQRVSPGYFGTMGMTLIEGRGFQEMDDDSAELVAIVGASLARRLWPDGGAVGRRIRSAASDTLPWHTVVGVAEDVRRGSIGGSAGAEVYLSSLQAPDGWSWFLVHAEGEPSGLIEAVTGVFHSLDPNQPVFDFRTMRERVLGTAWRERAAASLFGAFALTCLLLAASGVFAVVAFAVRRRRREIGIRVALGAGRSRVIRETVGEGLTPTLIGAGVGLLGGAALGQGLRGLLFGVEPFDPLTFLGGPGTLLAVALLAALFPAWRAAAIDPARVFREGR